MEQLIRPRKSSHQANIQSNGYQPPVEPLDSAFCNSFWIQADKRLLPGSDPAELGSEGYNTIMQRMKNGSRTLEELRTFLRERLVEWSVYRVVNALVEVVDTHECSLISIMTALAIVSVNIAACKRITAVPEPFNNKIFADDLLSWNARAMFEDEFSKKLSKQSKVAMGPTEIGWAILK